MIVICPEFRIDQWNNRGKWRNREKLEIKTPHFNLTFKIHFTIAHFLLEVVHCASIQVFFSLESFQQKWFIALVANVFFRR